VYLRVHRGQQFVVVERGVSVLLPITSTNADRFWILFSPWDSSVEMYWCILCYCYVKLSFFGTVHQPPLSHIIRTTCLKFFSHIACADLSMDHSRAIRSFVTPLPSDCNRQMCRPHHI